MNTKHSFGRVQTLLWAGVLGINWSCCPPQPPVRSAAPAHSAPPVTDTAEQEDPAPSGPPLTRRDNVVDVIHRVSITDPYRWLEDQQSAETRTWIAAQNAYTDSQLGALPQREHLRRRLEQLVAQGWTGTPTVRRGRYFYAKQDKGQDLAAIYFKRDFEGEVQTLVDPVVLDETRKTSVALYEVSPSGKLLAYSLRRGGKDEIEIRILDAESGRDIADHLPSGLYSGLSFALDDSGFYYTHRTRTGGSRLYFHQIGASTDEDRLIFGEGIGPDKWVWAELSGTGRYLVIGVGHGWAKGDVYFIDLRQNGPVRPLIEGIDARFDFAFAKDQLVLMTNWEAPNNRLFAVDLRKPARRQWREIVSESEDVIEDFTVVGDRLYVNRLHNVGTQLAIYSLKGKPLGELPLPLHHSARLAGRWDSPVAFLSYESFTVPRQVFEIDTRSDARRLWYRQELPVDPDAFDTRQVWYPSKDGTRVPMFLVFKKGTEPDGNRPVYLTGYGGFNVSLVPRFNTYAVVIAEHGGVFARPNLRGGGEFGEKWHRAGMLENKQNVFDDFIAAAQWLIDNRYTTPERLAIQGGSNGGLLVGAALTQRPELFRAVLCEYPDLDMVRYHTFKDSNNPPALLEYGDASDPEQFKFLHAYSPYQRVQPDTAYPAVLLTTGDGDTRVPPLQARKMTARLQAATSSDRPILLLYDTDTGHAGGRTQAQILDYVTTKLSFVFWQLGIEGGQRSPR